jgi:hypothetical protein
VLVPEFVEWEGELDKKRPTLVWCILWRSIKIDIKWERSPVLFVRSALSSSS